jgi:hypothetical protein
MHQAADTTLLLGLFRCIPRRLLLLIEFAALRVRSTNEFGQASQARALGSVSLAAPSVDGG